VVLGHRLPQAERDLTAIPIVRVVMIMPSIPHEASVCHAHIQGAGNTEGQHGIAWNSDVAAARFASKRANYCSYYAVVAPRFKAIGLRS